MRMIVRLAKGEEVRFVSHLDMQRMLQRALRRAGLPIMRSMGYNPHMIVSFALALSVGQTSAGEYCEVELSEAFDASMFERRLSAALPAGFALNGCRFLNEGKAKLSTLMHHSVYDIRIDESPRFVSDLANKFLEQEAIIIPKRGKGGEKPIDIRGQALELTTSGGMLRAKLYTSAKGALTPNAFMNAAMNLLGERAAFLAHRLDIYTEEGVSLMDAIRTEN